jgi:hypothetical protein
VLQPDSHDVVTRLVSRISASADDPHKPFIERLTCISLFGLDSRVLELDNPTIFGFDISNVLLAIFGVLDSLLPVLRKLILPSAMPFRLVFPPKIAFSPTFMRPVVGIHVAAFCDHL